MEDLVSQFAGRSVFVTGHTGFKGSWLTLMLMRLGAKVHGYALAPATTPSLFELADIAQHLASHAIADVRNPEMLREALGLARPEIVFHLAAQPLVRASYRDPTTTWSTNVLGTVHLLEAVRGCSAVKSVVVVTTDKCYENREWYWGYRENDPLGGHDPYSTSKAATELVVKSYRQSFFQGVTQPLVATARAGNVIGGGDWSEDRLIADAARAAADGNLLEIRSPYATRPWQHVLESVHGYLRLATSLNTGDRCFADAFNFGPASDDNATVEHVMNRLSNYWPELKWHANPLNGAPHEAGLLCLDATKARRLLHWKPRWDLETALQKTAEWYRSVHAAPKNTLPITQHQISEFISAC